MKLTRAEKTVYSVLGLVLVLLFGAAFSGYGLVVLLLGGLMGFVLLPLIILVAVMSKGDEKVPPPP